MVITETIKKTYIQNLSGKIFTLEEAFEIQKFIDENFITDTNVKINWIDNKTKKRVIIGYQHSVSNKLNKKFLTKKEKQKILDMKTEKRLKKIIKMLMEGPVLNISRTKISKPPYFIKINKLPQYEKI